MSVPQRLGRAVRWTARGIGLGGIAYAAYVGAAWCRYGQVAPAFGDEADPLLDGFMPVYEVAERHSVRVMAPAETTLRVATVLDLQGPPLVRAIFKARELILGSQRDSVSRPKGLLAHVQSLGWRVLAETPGREIVVGAVTQPWMANVVFRGLPPDEFKAFNEPDYVKIVWNLRADPLETTESIFRTETRVMTTDAGARHKFRWYWARFSAGIILIRAVMLRQVKMAAQRGPRLPPRTTS